jgi:phosphoribosyl-AMP cyclohydrolase
VPDISLDNLKFDQDGLIPAIVQDDKTGQVLMMAWMNRLAVQKTIETGKTHFFSRSRNKQWLKGESSGHVQHVKSISVDCDEDVLLIRAEQVGAACHTGYYTCFYRQLNPKTGQWETIGQKVFDPETVYHK